MTPTGESLLKRIATATESGGTGTTYDLGTVPSLAGTTGTTPVMNLVGAAYIFDVQFTGTSIALQALGSDGITWRPILTLNSPGAAGVVLGHNATIRLYNPNATAVTSIKGSLT